MGGRVARITGITPASSAWGTPRLSAKRDSDTIEPVQRLPLETYIERRLVRHALMRERIDMASSEYPSPDGSEQRARWNYVFACHSSSRQIKQHSGAIPAGWSACTRAERHDATK